MPLSRILRAMFSHLVEHANGVVIIRLQGRLDQSGCDMLAQVLDRHAVNQGHIVLDMCDIDYLSSSTVSLLVQIARDTPAAELRLALAAVQTHVCEILQLSNLDELLPMYRTVEQALAAVAVSPAAVEMISLPSVPARDLVLRYLMLIQYGPLEHLEGIVHIDVTAEVVNPTSIEHVVGIQALRTMLEKVRSAGGVDIEITSIVAQSDAVSVWMNERMGHNKATSAGTHCAMLAVLRGTRISRVQILRGAPLDQI